MTPEPKKVKKIDGLESGSKPVAKIQAKPPIEIPEDQKDEYSLSSIEKKGQTIWVLRTTKGEKTNDTWLITKGKGRHQIRHVSAPKDGKPYLPPFLKRHVDGVRQDPDAESNLRGGYGALHRDKPTEDSWKFYKKADVEADKSTVVIRRPDGSDTKILTPYTEKEDRNGRIYVRDNDLQDSYVLSTNHEGAKFNWVLKKQDGKNPDGTARFSEVASFKNPREVRRYFNRKNTPMWPVRRQAILDTIEEARKDGYKGGFNFMIGNRSEIDKLIEEELVAAAGESGKKKMSKNLLAAILAAFGPEIALIAMGIMDSKTNKKLMEMALNSLQKHMGGLRDIVDEGKGGDEKEVAAKGGGGKKAKKGKDTLNESIFGDKSEKEKKTAKAGGGAKKGGRTKRADKNQRYLNFQKEQAEIQMAQAFLVNTQTKRKEDGTCLTDNLRELHNCQSYIIQRMV